MGKSCSGKDTVVNELVKRGFKKIVTYTSRPIRKGEKNGREYYYITRTDFADKIKDGFFAEYRTYDVGDNVWYYGSPIEEIVDASRSKDNYVIILTPDGVTKVISILKNHFSDWNAKVIYLYANQLTILKRLKKRKDKNDSIERRMNADNEDFKDAFSLADKIVYNNSDEISDVVDKIIKYVSND